MKGGNGVQLSLFNNVSSSPFRGVQLSGLSMIKEFCQEQFVAKGMIADFAIHDKGDGNPHAHILLTIRAMDEHGKWLPKARKVYDLDENGERIRLPSGNWKCHKENTVDWNDQKYAEVWRHSWETITNRYLEAAGSTSCATSISPV